MSEQGVRVKPSSIAEVLETDEAKGLLEAGREAGSLSTEEIALALGELEVPHGRTVWGALLVTGVFASALAYLIQVWAQRRISAARIAIVFSLETVFAGLFGYWLADDRLGVLGWSGCAVILAGIAVAEPTAGALLRRWSPETRSTTTRDNRHK